jgi:hypothetical protein
LHAHRYVLLALIAVFFPALPFGQEEAMDEEGDKFNLSSDSCGTLDGHEVNLNTKTKHEYYTKGIEGWDHENSIDMRVLSKGDNGMDTAEIRLFSWEDRFSGWMEEEVQLANGCKIRKKTLSLMDDTFVVAEFTYKNEALELSPAFRKRIQDGMDKGDSTVNYRSLQTLLSGYGEQYARIHQVLRLYAIRDSIRSGFVDASIASMQDFMEKPGEKDLLRYCRRLSDSLIAWKESKRPLTLEGAKKVGRILNPPVYPPLDSPSVFWKDFLLTVVQEDKASPTMMRAFDPRSGKWGAKSPVKYPESGMYQMYVKNTGTYSMMCPYVTVCWSKNLGAISDDPCEGLDCGPLLVLDDSAMGSVEDKEDLIKAGGSCAANNGTLEFISGGYIKARKDSTMAWPVFDRPPSYGSRNSGFTSSREYPVTVSPDQKWVAYALDSTDGKSIELWVARLKYK